MHNSFASPNTNTKMAMLDVCLTHCRRGYIQWKQYWIHCIIMPPTTMEVCAIIHSLSGPKWNRVPAGLAIPSAGSVSHAVALWHCSTHLKGSITETLNAQSKCRRSQKWVLMSCFLCWSEWDRGGVMQPPDWFHWGTPCRPAASASAAQGRCVGMGILSRERAFRTTAS